MRLSCLAASLWLGVAFAAANAPDLVRVYPLSGQAGTTVQVEILGNRLSNITGAEFDSPDLVWQKTTNSAPGKVTGEVWIASSAALGAHRVRLTGLDGPSNSAIFNVDQFPSIAESEPNDVWNEAQRISSFPVQVQGRLDGAADIDIYAFMVKSGERRVFDLRAIENGSAVETRMILMDAAGKQIVFNDDRNDYNENPLIEHTFPAGGEYYVKLDQYRGPRGFNFGKNCAYTLRISALPVIATVYPLAVRRGTSPVIRLSGTGLETLSKVYLTEIREAEYARMTYPYTMPIRFGPDSQQVKVEGRIRNAGPATAEASFVIPSTVRPGLWRLWAGGPNGFAEGLSIDVVDWPVESGLRMVPSVVNGALDKPGTRGHYRIEGRAGQPLHFWTLAAQLGVPSLDSVLTLRDAAGRRLAENDDVVAGQGTLLGNPDSSLFYTPQQDGPLFVEVTDRTGRGGTGFEYCLKVSNQLPGFQLFTTPENFTVDSGGSAELKVHLIREAGFKGEVNIWFEGLPGGIEVARGQFRADQLFEPNADGADMIIPDIAFKIQVPAAVPVGAYPIRIYGAPANAPAGEQVVEAHATLMMGPILDAWNFVRRPLPAITMTVVQPFSAELLTETRKLGLDPGKSTILQLKAENVPEDAQFRLINLPDGVQYRVMGRQGSQVTLSLDAGPGAAVGTFDIAAETTLGSRKATSASIVLSVGTTNASR
ncbi:MAG: hypothetical protein ABJF23_26760 [Bryobacteraceae bacterium]